MSLIGWKYSKEVVIDNTNNDNSYKNTLICINLSFSNFDFSKPRFDGSDIRFTDSDGTTLLDYWIEYYSIDSQTATIYVKVPIIPAHQVKSIYMWYGNPNAVNIGNRTIMELPRVNYFNPDPFNDGSCVVYYPFDGDTNDHSGDGHHETWHGNEQYDKGIFGQCAKFDGNSYIDRRAILGETIHHFSVSLWVYSGGSGTILWHGYRGWDEYSYFRIRVYEGVLYTTTHYFYGGTSTVAVDLHEGWNFITTTYDSSNNLFCVFIDGTLKGTRKTQPLIGQSWLYIGSSYEGNDAFIGKIDDLRFFDRVLSDEEVMTLYLQSLVHLSSIEQQHKSKLFGVACDKYGIPIVDKPVKVYVLNNNHQTLITSTTTTTGHWKFDNFPADPGSKVLVVYSLEGQYHDDNDIAGATFKETI